MSDIMPASPDFPTMGQGWPSHVCNVSGTAGGMRQATRPGKSTAADPKGPARSAAIIRNGNGPKPITVRRAWAGNIAEASATSRNIRIMPRSGNQFAGGRGDGSR
jgi:hypothetical protein